jgi:outer membrane protein assembly factor BamB
VWAACFWRGAEDVAYPYPPVCAESLQGLSGDAPLTRLERGLIVNLDHFKTPDDWRRVPGVKEAIKNFARRGKSVLADVEDDGELEVLGESRETSPEGHAIIACRRADGTELWRRELKRTNRDNNGAQCVDLDGDGVKELVIVGDTLCVYNARTGEEEWTRNILDEDFWRGKRFPGKPMVIDGKKIQFTYPWRVGHCTDKRQYDIIVGDCYRSGYPVGSSQGVQVACYRADGTLAWRYELDEPDYVGTVGHEIAVIDLDADGFDETILSQMGGGCDFVTTSEGTAIVSPRTISTVTASSR